MEIRTVSELAECEVVWNRFSPNETLWDDWDVILSLHNPGLHTPHFMVLSGKKGDRGLLPLMIEKATGDCYFFGGTLPECRKLWIEPSDFRVFIDHLPARTRLFDLRGAEKFRTADTQAFFSGEDTRYYIRLEQLNGDFNTYINSRFSGDRKKKFRAELKKVEALGLNSTWHNAPLAEDFIGLSKKRFADQSDFNSEENIHEVKSLTNTLMAKGMLHTLIIRSETTQAVTMAAYYKKVFTVIYAASNKEIQNLGKSMHVQNIKKAMSLGAEEINYMVGHTSWKEFWKMDKEDCISFIKP
jgi:hypothetical protein